jgi:hypothetical protein
MPVLAISGRPSSSEWIENSSIARLLLGSPA